MNQNDPTIFGHSDTGMQRSNNEDLFIAEKLKGKRYILAAVIDGVGGYEGGEIAAEIASTHIKEAFRKILPEPDIQLKQAFILANEAIYKERTQQEQRANMACVATAVVADLQENKFYFAHVGDTRLYLYRDGSLVKVTHDHSFVGFLEDSNRLSEEEAMRHPKRNEINKALGFDVTMAQVQDYAETGQSPFLPGDILLICSDGLTDLVNKAQMKGILEGNLSLAEKTNALIAAANEAGGKDNITVVLVKNNKVPIKIEATKPVATPEKINKPETFQVISTDEPPVVKKKNTLTILLTCICLVLAGLLVWQWYNSRQNFKDTVKTVRMDPWMAGFKNRMTVSDTIHLKSLDSTGKLMQHESMVITKDSLWIIGEGTSWQADSGFTGPALVLDSGCRFLGLENITFKNLNTVAQSEKTYINLKNVRFDSCSQPFKKYYSIRQGQFITGHIKDTSAIIRDSIQKKP